MKNGEGLIHAYLLDGTGGGRRLDMVDIEAWTREQGVLWAHFDYTSEDARQWLQNSAGLQDLVADALLVEETRPRATSIDDGLLIALRGINTNPGAEPDDMVAVRLWVDDKRIISTRERVLFSARDIAEQLDAGRGPADAADFLVALADRIVWRISDTVDKCEDLVADLEDQVLDASSSSLRFDLATLRRQTITLRRYLAPQRDAFAQLITGKTAWLDDDSRQKIREVSDRLIRNIEDLDAVRERAAVTQEELLSRLSDQMNTRMYVLSVVAAIFLPLGFLTGLLGINVGGIPGTENPWAFLIFSLLIVGILVVQMLWFKYKKWF
ncbi:MAG: zinc transporter ZntB [Thiogranum sp.]